MEGWKIESIMSELQQKLASKETTITAQDMENARAAASASQRTEHIVLVGMLKRRLLETLPELTQDPAAEPVTDAQVKAAHAAAKENPSINNVARYSELKRQFKEQPVKPKTVEEMVNESYDKAIKKLDEGAAE